MLIEREAEHCAESVRYRLELSTGCQFSNLLGARRDRKKTEVAEEEVALISDCSRHDVTLARRDIDHSRNLPAGSDLVHFSVVWLDRIKVTANRHHAVPGSIRFEIIRFWIRNGISLQERAEVRDQGEGSV